MYIGKLLDLLLQLMKNGSTKEAFIFLLSVQTALHK